MQRTRSEFLPLYDPISLLMVMKSSEVLRTSLPLQKQNKNPEVIELWFFSSLYTCDLEQSQLKSSRLMNSLSCTICPPKQSPPSFDLPLPSKPSTEDFTDVHIVVDRPNLTVQIYAQLLLDLEDLLWTRELSPVVLLLPKWLCTAPRQGSLCQHQ